MSFRCEAEESAVALWFVIPQRSGGIRCCPLVCHSAAQRRNPLCLLVLSFRSAAEGSAIAFGLSFRSVAEESAVTPLFVIPQRSGAIRCCPWFVIPQPWFIIPQRSGGSPCCSCRCSCTCRRLSPLTTTSGAPSLRVLCERVGCRNQPTATVLLASRTQSTLLNRIADPRTFLIHRLFHRVGRRRSAIPHTLLAKRVPAPRRSLGIDLHGAAAFADRIINFVLPS